MIDFVSRNGGSSNGHPSRVTWLVTHFGLLAAHAVLVASAAHAQNLVPNPSFENYTTCPNSASQITFAFPWNTPTAGSPDYFHACDITPNNFSVPANSFGTEPAHTGNGYAGIRVYTPTPFDNYREYLEVPLTTPLVAAAVYEVSFYASLADPFKYAIENLDVHLAVGAVGPLATSVNLSLSPLVTNPTGMITNKAGWRQVSGLYTANGGESHLVLGNFRTDAATNSQNVGGGCCSYYFIDDVSVMRVSCAPAPSDMVAWYTGDDTTPSDLLGQHDGAYVGFPVSSVDWIVGGGALEFHAPDTYAIVPDHNDLDFGTGDFSIDMWVKTTANTGVQSLVDKRVASATGAVGAVGYAVFLFNGALSVQLADPPLAHFNYISALPVADGNWHFVAVTVDRDDPTGMGMKLYVDGSSQTFDPRNRQGNLDNTASLLIGARQSTLGGGVFTGLMDEIEVFERALTPAEVEEIYWAGSAGKCKCEPLPDGSGCRSTSCPDQNHSCQATQLEYEPMTEQYRVTDCDCLSAEACHVGLLTNFPPEPPEPYCDGEACPLGKLCALNQTMNGDGTITYDCCQSLPPMCGPNEAGTDCNAVMCPNEGQRCRPRCLRQSVATGQIQVIDCDCRDVEGCHAVLGSEGVVCDGVCPPGMGCHRTQSLFTDPGTGNAYVDVCCDCEEVCPLQDPPLPFDPCNGFQSQDCLNGGANDSCLPHCATLFSNYFCPKIPPSMTGCDCACAAPGSCGPVSVTGVGEPYYWNNLPYYHNYLFSCSGDCTPPEVEVCKLFHKGSNSSTYSPTGLISALATQLAAGSVKCDCAESPPPTCEPNAAGTACQGSCNSGLTCQPMTVTCDGQTCVITDCSCIGNTCHAVFPPPPSGANCVGVCPISLPCQSSPVMNPDGSTTHRCRCGFTERYGDFDADGDFDLRDMSYFQNCFSGTNQQVPANCSPADLDADEDVDLSDFARIHQTTLSCPSTDE